MAHRLRRSSGPCRRANGRPLARAAARRRMPGVPRFADLTRAELAVAARDGALIVLPLGATEQHADHLPVGTDATLAEALSLQAAASCTGTRVLVLPTLAFGLSPHHRAWAGTVTLSAATLVAVLTDIARSLAETGFARLLIVNGHGGNVAPMGVAVTELCAAGFACGAVNHFAPGEPAWRPLLRGRFDGVGHACEFETALQLTLAGAEAAARIAARLPGLPPRLAQPYLADDAAEDPIRRAGALFAPVFPEGDVGYYGDPAAATRETGDAIRAALVGALAAFFTAFAKAPLRVLPRR
jgi:creatinine amidohydrolase